MPDSNQSRPQNTLFEARDFSDPKEFAALIDGNVFRYCAFEGFHLDGGMASTEFYGCQFIDIDWYWAFFNLCIFVDVEFTGCTFQGPAFADCKFVNCTFIRCKLEQDNLGADPRFDDCKWYDCQFEECSGFPSVAVKPIPLEGRLKPVEKEIYRRVDEVVFYVWDPIGVGAGPEVREEYSSYVPQIFTMLMAKKPKADIANHLESTVIERMGLKPDRGRLLEIVELLEAYRDLLVSRASHQGAP